MSRRAKGSWLDTGWFAVPFRWGKVSRDVEGGSPRWGFEAVRWEGSDTTSTGVPSNSSRKNDLIDRRILSVTLCVFSIKDPGVQTKDLHNARQRLGVGVVFVAGALQTINVGDVGQDHPGLIAHHAAGKETKKNSFDEETQNAEHLGGSVQTGVVVRSNIAVVSQAVKESNRQEGQGIDTRYTRIENKEQKVLVVANPDTIVHPGTVVC